MTPQLYIWEVKDLQGENILVKLLLITTGFNFNGWKFWSHPHPLKTYNIDQKWGSVYCFHLMFPLCNNQNRTYLNCLLLSQGTIAVLVIAGHFNTLPCLQLETWLVQQNGAIHFSCSFSIIYLEEPLNLTSLNQPFHKYFVVLLCFIQMRLPLANALCTLEG